MTRTRGRGAAPAHVHGVSLGGRALLAGCRQRPAQAPDRPRLHHRPRRARPGHRVAERGADREAGLQEHPRRVGAHRQLG